MKSKEIENIIGYVFKNKKLLERALTHGSVDTRATKNYQSLEFLGDSILDFIVSKRLMELYPDAHEGALTQMRASIVSRKPLAEEIEAMGLAAFLAVGKGENKARISEQSKIKSDLYESVVAAIYLDSGNIDEAESFVLRTLDRAISCAGKPTAKVDHKSVLNEYCSKYGKKAQYKMTKESGPPHAPIFKYSVYVDKEIMGEGEGKTKRDAQQIAAKTALENLKSAD